MAYTTRHRRSVRRLSFEQFESRLCLSSVSFASHLIAEVSMGTVASVQAADLDGDGDIDVVSSDAWYENADGNGTFVHRDGGGWDSVVHAADLDADGDIDVVSSDAWYENADGSGTFVHRDGGGWDSVVYAADLDGDGDTDILDVEDGGFGSLLVLYQNIEGARRFTREVVVVTGVDAAEVHVDAADLDGDSDLDVISDFWWGPMCFNPPCNYIQWTQNNGQNGLQVTHDVGMSDTPGWLHAADVDNDGDTDILSALPGQVAWYENVDGLGAFVPRTSLNGVNEFGLTRFQWIFTADMDHDGDLDLLAESSTYDRDSRTYVDNTIAWYENSDGAGAFGAQQVITTDVSIPVAVHAADLDGDGDTDVLSASAGNITWYENFSPKPGDANRDGQFNQQDIVHVLQAAKYLTGERATWGEGDWDGDGVFDQLDIVVALLAGNYQQGRYTGFAADSVFTACGA